MAKKGREKASIDPDKIPHHVAIIMDGNGRWAKSKLMHRSMGHRAGMATLKKIVRTSDELGIAFLTVFAFSTENWKRPKEEVDYLMQLLAEFLRIELDELHRENVRINILGDYGAVPQECQQEINRALALTRQNTGLVFNIALNYGSRQELIEVVKKLAAKVVNQELLIDDLNEEIFSSLLYTESMPDPDLLIRTAGEKRISNFMLWQIAYTELIVLDKLWPDLKPQDFKNAIIEYQQRDRKFGGLNNE